MEVHFNINNPGLSAAVDEAGESNDYVFMRLPQFFDFYSRRFLLRKNAEKLERLWLGKAAQIPITGITYTDFADSVKWAHENGFKLCEEDMMFFASTVHRLETLIENPELEALAAKYFSTHSRLNDCSFDNIARKIFVHLWRKGYKPLGRSLTFNIVIRLAKDGFIDASDEAFRILCDYGVDIGSSVCSDLPKTDPCVWYPILLRYVTFVRESGGERAESVVDLRSVSSIAWGHIYSAAKNSPLENEPKLIMFLDKKWYVPTKPISFRETRFSDAFFEKLLDCGYKPGQYQIQGLARHSKITWLRLIGQKCNDEFVNCFFAYLDWRVYSPIALQYGGVTHAKKDDSLVHDMRAIVLLVTAQNNKKMGRAAICVDLIRTLQSFLY
jgi:hypothetical protein